MSGSLPPPPQRLSPSPLSVTSRHALELSPRACLVEFVKPSEVSPHLTCSSCKGVLFNAFQSNHGCRLCEKCKVKALNEQSSDVVRCPGKTESCEDEVEGWISEINPDHDIKVDTATRRDVGKLLVFCINKNFGCEEQMLLKAVDRHLNMCEYEFVPCELCSANVQLKNIASHLQDECPQRRVLCEYCSKEVVFSKLENHINLKFQDCCVEVTGKCPFCGAPGPYTRNQLEQQHLESCSAKPVACNFSDIGCAVRDTVDAIEEHCKSAQGMSKHIYLLRKSQRIFKEEVLEKMDKLDQKVTENAKQVDNIYNKLKKLQSGVAPRLESVLQWERTCDALGGASEVNSVFVDMRDKVRTHEEQLQALKTGSSTPLETTVQQLNIRIADTDRRVRLAEAAITDGVLLWKIDGYYNRKQMAKTGEMGSFYSQPFYTDRYGYKMCARIYLNGDGTATNRYVSLYFVLMKGKFDDLLSWPFNRRVTLMLMDLKTGDHKREVFRPDPSSSSFSRPTTDMNIASGSPKFVSHADLETDRYMTKDGSCYVKVVVEKD